MAPEQPGSDSESGPTPGACRNAAEYVLKRLNDADEPMGAPELAEEYGCSRPHVSDTLSKLHEAGAVTRAAHGRYELAEGAAPDDPGGSLKELADDTEQDESGGEAAATGSPSLPISTTGFAVGVVIVVVLLLVLEESQPEQNTQEAPQTEPEDGRFVEWM